MTPQAEVLSITPKATSSAEAFLFDIRAAIAEAANSESTALAAAIRCGRLLIKAKENLKAEKKGPWLPWLDKHDIPRRTAALYKRLAEHEDEIHEAGYASIREADAGLRDRERDDEADDGGEKSNAVANSSSGKSPIRRRTRSNQSDAELSELVPDEVFTMLRETFCRDYLTALATLLANHLSETAA